MFESVAVLLAAWGFFGKALVYGFPEPGESYAIGDATRCEVYISAQAAPRSVKDALILGVNGCIGKRVYQATIGFVADD